MPPRKRCPGMDPAHFRPEDIALVACVKCRAEIEFWKSDVKLACSTCGTVNVNPNVANTCLSWCDKAAECVGSMDIEEWKKKQGGSRTPRPRQ
jgi:hypothetical protein